MLIGKVKGSVVSTRKCERLVGNKFMIVEVLKQHVQTGGADQRPRVGQLQRPDDAGRCRPHSCESQGRKRIHVRD